MLPCAHRLTEEHAEGDCSKSCARHAYEALRAAPSTDVVAVAPLMLQRNALCEKGGLERLLLKRARSNAACKGWDAVSVWVAGYCSVPVKVTDDSAEDVYDWLASMPDSPVSVKCRFLAVQQTLRRRVVQRRRTVVEAELTGQQIAAAVALASVQPTPSKTLHRFLERTAVKTKKTKKTREKPNSRQVQRTEAEARSKSRVLAVEQYYDKEDWASEQDARAAAASLWGEALEGRGLTMDDFYRVLSMQRKSPGCFLYDKSPKKGRPKMMHEFARSRTRATQTRATVRRAVATVRGWVVGFSLLNCRSSSRTSLSRCAIYYTYSLTSHISTLPTPC